MADKEERILIARSSDYTLTDTDKGELFEGKIAPHSVEPTPNDGDLEYKKAVRAWNRRAGEE